MAVAAGATLWAGVGATVSGLATAPPAAAAQGPQSVSAHLASMNPDPYPDSDYHRTAADRGKPITPEESFIRGQDWIDAAPTYDQGNTSITDRHGTAYRADCSGFVSMAWQTKGVYSTETIEQVAHRVAWDELQPGDALLRHTGGGRTGHVRLVETVDRQGPYVAIGVMEFGSTPPTRNATTESGARSDGYYPIRYDKMQVVTDSMVREKLADLVPKPKPTIEPPGGQTIVNFPTIFYTSGAPYHATVPMAGGSVQVELYAARTAFRWHFGDGITRETSDPGAPYPHETVTHPYDSAGRFSPSVDITWGHFRYRIVGQDGWHSVEGSFTPDGPQTRLRSVEALDLLGAS